MCCYKASEFAQHEKNQHKWKYFKNESKSQTNMKKNKQEEGYVVDEHGKCERSRYEQSKL